MDPRSWPREALLAIAAVAIALLVLQVLARAWVRAARRRAVLARVRRAGEGEARAASFLADLGYTVLASQAVATYEVLVDGEPVTAQVRADYLVERGGARFVAEVKTGSVAPRIETAATRRQLLEYRVAFDVDGVLLVDAEEGRVREVVFPVEGALRAERAGGGRLVLIVTAALAIAALALLSR